MHEHSCRDQAADCTRFKVPKTVAPLGVGSVAAAKSSLGSLVSVKSCSHHPPPTGAATSGVYGVTSGVHGLPPMSLAGANSSAGVVDVSAATAAATSVVSTPTSSASATPLASPLFSASNR